MPRHHGGNRPAFRYDAEDQKVHQENKTLLQAYKAKDPYEEKTPPAPLPTYFAHKEADLFPDRAQARSVQAMQSTR